MTASFFSPSPKKFTNIRQKPYSKDDFDHDHNKCDCPKTAKYMIWSYNPRSISTSCLRDAEQRPGDAPPPPRRIRSEHRTQRIGDGGGQVELPGISLPGMTTGTAEMGVPLSAADIIAAAAWASSRIECA